MYIYNPSVLIARPTTKTNTVQERGYSHANTVQERGYSFFSIFGFRWLSMFDVRFSILFDASRNIRSGQAESGCARNPLSPSPSRCRLRCLLRCCWPSRCLFRCCWPSRPNGNPQPRMPTAATRPAGSRQIRDRGRSPRAASHPKPLMEWGTRRQIRNHGWVGPPASTKTGARWIRL